MATGKPTAEPGFRTHAQQIGKGLAGLGKELFSAARNAVDPNTQLRDLVKKRYSKLLATGMTEEAAVEATVTAVRTELVKAIAEEKAAEGDTDGEPR